MCGDECDAIDEKIKTTGAPKRDALRIVCNENFHRRLEGFRETEDKKRMHMYTELKMSFRFKPKAGFSFLRCFSTIHVVLRAPGEILAAERDKSAL